ncbi:MAG: serine hydrolase [Roseivirga sp.]|nr:serine hydrolase [Roseivirga sp.]
MTYSNYRRQRINIWQLIILIFLGVSCSQENQGQEISALKTKVNTIVAEAANGAYGEIHSLLVFKNNELIAEEYFGAYDADSLHFQYSVTKSISSLLVGIAMDQGRLSTVDQKLYELFPEYSNDIAHWTDQKAGMTLKDVLTMSAGYQWDEWTYTYTDTRNDANKLIRSDDLMKFVLDLPMAYEPGSRFTYNSGCSMLLSGIVQNSTGMSLESFAKTNLFDKLGITKWRWEQGKDGKFNSGWGLHLRPRDMLKIGKMVLSGGVWEGQRIVSEDWLRASQTNHISNYGYQWWLSTDFFSARGWGGQVIAIVPSEDLVIVTTAGNFSGGNPAGIRIVNQLIGLR